MAPQHETEETETHGGVQGEGGAGSLEGHGYGEPDRGEVRGASRAGVSNIDMQHTLHIGSNIRIYYVWD